MDSSGFAASLPNTDSPELAQEIFILEPEALKNFAKEHSPKWIVNCSAYTAVDKAEEDIDAAYAINRQGVANIAHILTTNHKVSLEE